MGSVSVVTDVNAVRLTGGSAMVCLDLDQLGFSTTT
jgi:hypothetical protein